MTRLPKRLRGQGLSPEEIKQELDEAQEAARRRDIYRAERVREAKNYRYARRAGWRLLNEQLVKEGRNPLSWATFNQPLGVYQIGTRPSVYRAAETRGKTWEEAFHHGEKKRRYRQAHGALPEGMTA